MQKLWMMTEILSLLMFWISGGALCLFQNCTHRFAQSQKNDKLAKLQLITV